MTRAVLWVLPTVVVVSVLVLGGGDPLAVAALVLLALGAATTLWLVSTTRVRSLARAVQRLIGGATGPPIEVTGGGAWRELATAVNALGGQLRGAQHELRSLVPWTDRLVSSLEDPAVVFDADRRLVAANAAAVVDLRLSTTNDPPTALSALGSAAAAAAVEEAADVGRIVTVEEGLGDRELRVTASPLDEHVLVVVSDRTRERQIEELRRDFVTNASHELQTPVMAITTLTEALRVAPEDRREGLELRLEEEAARLGRLVRDLLDLRRLDDQGRGLERQPFDLVELVAGAIDAHDTAAAPHGLTFETTLPASALVVGVERELRLVVDNLVANAVQYNREGGTVSVTVAPAAGEQVLTVEDTGIGIPQQALGRVFERFYRVDVGRSRERGGTGLGLSLVRHAVERHGGQISIESLLGVGTTVTVRLPVGP